MLHFGIYVAVSNGRPKMRKHKKSFRDDIQVIRFSGAERAKIKKLSLQTDLTASEIIRRSLDLSTRVLKATKRDLRV